MSNFYFTIPVPMTTKDQSYCQEKKTKCHSCKTKAPVSNHINHSTFIIMRCSHIGWGGDWSAQLIKRMILPHIFVLTSYLDTFCWDWDWDIWFVWLFCFLHAIKELRRPSSLKFTFQFLSNPTKVFLFGCRLSTQQGQAGRVFHQPMYPGHATVNVTLNSCLGYQ